MPVDIKGNCSDCGGTHYGTGSECVYIEKPCVVCGDATVMACSDCAINSSGKDRIHVCQKSVCHDTHEKEKHPVKVYTQREVRNLIIGQLVANLRNDSIVDIDEPRFIEQAMTEQKRIADKLQREF